jgi:glycosyltransferase involved in cell wall biosynthesis
MSWMHGETIIMVEGGSLKGIKQRHRQLAERFAHDNRVIYIEEPGNVVTVFISKEKPFSNLWTWMGGFVEIQDNFVAWTPPPGLPFGYIYPWVNAWNHFWYRFWYPIVCREMPKQPILISNNILGLKWLGFFGEKLRIYDCCDEITGFKVPSLKPDVVRRKEKELIEACDFVICSSQKLFDTKSPMAKKTFLIRNGAEVEHFRKALVENFPKPDPIKDIDKPIVGFYGYLGDWLDWDAIEYCIHNAPDLHFLLIGPATKGLTQYIDAENVTYTGPMPYDVLPQYLAHFACALLPFVQNDYTAAVNPVKVYEYLAGGRPTVVTPLPELVTFSDQVYFAEDGPTFLESIRKAIAEDSPEKRNARVGFVKGQDWDARVGEIYTAIGEFLSKSAV